MPRSGTPTRDHHSNSGHSQHARDPMGTSSPLREYSRAAATRPSCLLAVSTSILPKLIAHGRSVRTPGSRPQRGENLFLTPFADDLILLGTTREQAQRLLRDSEDTLQAIGLHFNSRKCKFLRPPGMSDQPLYLRNGNPIQAQPSLVFLGVLLAFNITCYAVIAARMTQVNNAFWGYFRVLRQAGVGLVQRLRVFNCFVTSRWRWMSPAFRPLKSVRDFSADDPHYLSNCHCRVYQGSFSGSSRIMDCAPSCKPPGSTAVRTPSLGSITC